MQQYRDQIERSISSYNSIAQRIQTPSKVIVDNRSMMVRQRKLQAAIHQTLVIQKRDLNPHAASGTHEGLSLTAHHIIAHSKLVDALKLLSPAKQKEILIASVPTTITAAMLNNVGAPLTDEEKKDEAESLRRIRSRLVDPNEKETDQINGPTIKDIRSAFYEWQAGNQFSGPNTSIRAEPESRKEAIDTDGQYFNKDIYDQLKEHGDSLYEQLNNKAKNKDEIAKTLLAMVTLTRDATPGKFEPSEWVETSSYDEVEWLKEERGHTNKYTYFKISLADLKGDKYNGELKEMHGKIHYKGVEYKSTIGFPYIYVSYECQEALKTFLKSKNVPLSTYLPKESPGIKKINKKKEEKAAILREAQRQKLENKITKTSKEVSRLEKLKKPTKNQSKRLTLFSKKYRDANIALNALNASKSPK